jgi:very-short-patch-repair endonuclease
MARPPARPSAQKFARTLRNGATDAEKLLWQELRRGKLTGARFRRQVPIGPYVADFACLQNKLIVELDGSQHVERAAYDLERSAFFETLKFRVLRFWNGDLFGERASVIETIVHAIEHPDWRQEPESPSPTLPLRGRESDTRHDSKLPPP